MKDTLYTLENRKIWKCMSYDGSNIYLSTKDKSTTDELIESCNSKKGMLSMEKTKVVSINGITKLAFIEKEDSIEIKSNELIDDLKFDSPESRKEIC